MCARADLPVLHSPVTDKDISTVLSSEFQAHADQRLSKIQSSVQDFDQIFHIRASMVNQMGSFQSGQY